MDKAVFDEVESMVQMNEPREIEVTQEILKENVYQSQIVVPSLKTKNAKKVCHKMPTKRIVLTVNLFM